MHDIVVMTDHSSTEGSRAVLAEAVRRLTGRSPVQVDSRPFMSGGGGRAQVEEGLLELAIPGQARKVTTSTLVIYEVPPTERHRLESFQRLLHRAPVATLGGDPDAWRVATDKNLMVDRLARHGVPQMATIGLSRPTADAALAAFARLGGDVWARPAIGMGGADVFHARTPHQLRDAARHYAAAGQDWLISRDAHNYNRHGRRHQYRVVVLLGRVVRAVEHVQPDPDAPCNECRGATSTLLAPDSLPAGLGRLAISAAEAVGLPLAGVDLAAENGGVVFEVNVHPAFGTDRGLETVAIPYVQAHLAGWAN